MQTSDGVYSVTRDVPVTGEAGTDSSSSRSAVVRWTRMSACFKYTDGGVNQLHICVIVVLYLLIF